MTIEYEWIVLDTNVWIFGLRNQPEKISCTHLLSMLPRLWVKVPRQVILELLANLTERERRDFFYLVNQYPDRIDVSWDKVELWLIRKYQALGCKLGDAAISAHLEALDINVLVSENRDFLQELTGQPFRVVSAEEALKTFQKRDE
ncbi:MAG: hypothetical protein ETSY2_49250 [Candidatus Entotheonella gemina]|uniref:PIN domain-containing protein n=1 Tax=Candidatus Entotheonella gemina TaxID=1429439 RepID=W4L9Q2_9BACT|nr:MAG: hypothetical protein ETSY2_49250 [Candidatus Entotheonella gemina]